MKQRCSFEKGGKSLKLTYIVLILSTLFITLPVIVKANPSKYTEKDNMFYIQVLNKSMPLAKVTVFDKENLLENSFDIKKELLGLFSIKLEDPLTVLEKEISLINTSKIDNQVDYDPEPFKLDEKYVLKEEVNQEINKKVHNSNLKKQLDKSKPEIFIYHTHATETYKPEDKYTLDMNKNMCMIGDMLAKDLEENYGISVIHDKTVHDAKSRSQSYERSGPTVDRYLKKYGDFKLVIDLHRDGVDDPKLVTTKINGENVAKSMFVISRDNPQYNKNLKVANDLVEISNRLFPGLFRYHCYRDHSTRYFHQNKSGNSVLIELGANSNNLQDAKNSVKYLARIMGEYINGK